MVNERIGRTGGGLKAEDITPGSEIANIIGMLYYNVSCVGLTDCRKGNR